MVLIVASVFGIFAVVWRKMPYLEKVVVQADAGSDLFYDYFPELMDFIKGLKLNEHRDVWLVEFEKLLRRLRIVSLKMDRLSDSLIKKIRKVGESSKTSPAAVLENNGVTEMLTAKPQRDTTLDDIRREEQRLIIEIAKNPKNPNLYETLGDLYVKINNLPDAKESYEAAMELNSANEGLKKKHSQVLENMLK